MNELFEKAASLVEQGWCQGVSARRGNLPAKFDNDFATCFCAAGAIARVSNELHGRGWREPYSDALVFANKVIRTTDPKLHLMSWNDVADRTQEQVVSLLRLLSSLAVPVPA